MSFSEWKEIKLGELLNFRRGHDLPKTKMLDGNIPVVGSNGIIGFHNEVTTKAPCLTIGRSGNIGNPCYINKDCWAHNTSLYVDDFKGNDPKYLYYLLKTLNLGHYGGGSAVPTLNRNHIHPIEIKATINLAEQKAIAHILSTLDDKIEVNNQINKTLDNMAQAIFKQWFMDFEFPNEDGEPYKSSGGEMVESELGMIPKGWEVGKLDDIATIVMGQSPKGTSYNEVGEGEVFYQGRTDFSSRFPIRRLFTTEPKRMANDGDVLMSVRAPVGDLNVANERCCIGRGLSAISSSADLSSYILYVMHDLRERLNVYNGEGTVFGSINQKDLKSIKVISSCDNKTEIAFDELIQPIDRMIRNNEDETRRLINLRDRLLPKLLSGEIRVPLDEEGDAS